VKLKSKSKKQKEKRKVESKMKTLKEILDAIPLETPPGFDEECKVKNLTPLIDEIERLGYTVEAHQRGISGTFLCAVPVVSVPVES
jgi:hypothetical protein